jgi:cell division protein FtsB
MRQLVRRRARSIATRLVPDVVATLDQLRADVAEQQLTIGRLRRRVEEVEAEMQECRALNHRIAELTDIVQELLVPAARRDTDKLDELLARYADRL